MLTVLTLNGGSSSIRFAFYDARNTQVKLLSGKIERIGTAKAALSVDSDSPGAPEVEVPLENADHSSAIDVLLRWLAARSEFACLGAIGHRIVHGMAQSDPQRVTSELIAELKRIVPYDPEHLPREIQLIEAVIRLHPQIPQVACFDTAFHRGMPRVATMLPIPRRYESKGIRRYGFHGLSYTYLMTELRRVAGAGASKGRVILAHLGNGASLAAVRGGSSVDTSMGFTPTAGLVMSTRSGDLDPGIMNFLSRTESMDAAQYERMVTHESGLLGVSETSSDIRDLLQREAEDVRAAEAIALFCYQVKKWIGAFAAALGGIDTLVFAGGIGENSAVIRARVCEGLEFLGIELNPGHNTRGAALISAVEARVAVRVIRTDEESIIASSTVRVLAL